MKPEATDQEYSPYCPVCDGCGEEGCCSPLRCKQDEHGQYCKTYLNDLKFAYLMYEDLAKKIFEDQERYADLIVYHEQKVDENLEKIYKE